MTTTLNFSVDDNGVALIEIDLPDTSMNVLNETLMTELDAAVDRVIAEEGIVGAVITSAKKDFVAGADLRMLQAQTARRDELGASGMYAENIKFNKLLRKLETGGHSAKALLKGEAAAKPVVAAVRGQALGGGFELTLCCHARVATSSAKFGLPEVKVGLLPGAGGTQRLPRMIGIQPALQYLTTGGNIKADQALGMKIVDAVVEDADLIEAAKAKVLELKTAVQPWDKKGFKVPGGAGAFDPRTVQTFAGAGAMAIGQTYGNYDAVKNILSCVYEGTILPIDRALEIETKYFTNLTLGEQSAAMIRSLFVNKLAAEKGMRRPEGLPVTKFSKVGVLGAGLMGAGIAYESAKAGMEVVLIDISQEAADKGKDYSQKLVDKAVGRGRLAKEKGEALLGKILPTTDYEALKGADLIIEAVFEDVGIKKDVTAKAEAVVGADTPFGSNTSTLPITQLQESWSKPENFIGIHFFSPVEKMPLVEMIMGEKTGDKALAVALDYVRAIKKTPIVVNDGRGFYTSRCVGSYNDEGDRMLSEGVAPALIENSGRMAGYPMGPLQLLDSVAIDLAVKIGKATIKALGDDYDPGPAHAVNVKMVEEFGRFGIKNGKGFYDYAEGSVKPSGLWPGLADAFPVSDEQPDPKDVRDRLIYRQTIDCIKCLEENILTNPAEGDIGSIFGWGFPPFTGGPFSYVDGVGVGAFVARAEELSAKYGERFEPPQILRDMVKDNNRRFFPLEDAA